MTNWTGRLARRIRALLHRDALDRDIDDEMRLHIEMEANELARVHGLSAAEAGRRAAISCGGSTGSPRSTMMRSSAGSVAADVRLALRRLANSPGFTIVATLTLALGIGASTAIFSAVDTVLVSRLPYPADDRLVRIYQQNSPTNRFGLSAADYLALAAQQRSFASVGALRGREVTLAVDGRVRRSTIGAADAGFFSALGVRAARGRLVTKRYPANAFVAVGPRFAVREFGGDGSSAGVRR
jgi:hypothetical protein